MSGPINDGGPAFPIPLDYDQSWAGHGSPNGMSLRDWFAGQALPPPDEVKSAFVEALVGREYSYETGSLEHWQFWAEAYAKWKYMQADAMLAAREATS